MNLIEQLGGLVYGVGINDRSRPSYIKGKAIKEYDHWTGMLERCYSKSKHMKSRPTYNNCFASENFKNYSYFYDWCQDQVGFIFDGWQLDKDILFEGNKLYSEKTCVFVPSEVNNFILTKTARNKSGFVGVSFHKASGKYCAQINFNNKRKHLGLFEDPKEGEKYYLMVKHQLAMDLAKKYDGVLDDRVVNILCTKYESQEEIKAGKRL